MFVEKIIVDKMACCLLERERLSI